MAKVYDVYNYKMPGFTTSDVQLSFPNLKAQMTGLSDLEKRIASVTNFAVERMGEEAIKAGQQFAIENAPTVEQFLAANPEQRMAIFGEDDTTFGQSAKTTMLSFVTNDLYNNASIQIAEAEADALDPTTGRISNEQFLNELTAIKEEYVNAMMPIDAESAVKLDAKLATDANNSYVKIIADNQKFIKELGADIASQAIVAITDQIEGFIDNPQIIEDRPLNFEESVALQKAKIETILLENFDYFDEEARNKIRTNYINKVQDIKKGQFETYIREYPQMTNILRSRMSNDILEIFPDIERDKDTNAYIVPEGQDAQKYIDAMTLENLYNNSSDIEKNELFDLEEMTTVLEGIATSIDNETKSHNEQRVSNAKTQALTAIVDGNRTSFDEAIGVLLALDPDDAKTYRPLYDNAVSTTNVNTSTALRNNLYIRIAKDNLKLEDVLKYTSAETSPTGEVLNGDHFKNIIEYLEKRKEPIFDASVQYLNNSLLRGFDPKFGIRMNDDKLEQLDIYTKALNDLNALPLGSLTTDNYIQTVDGIVNKYNVSYVNTQRNDFIYELSAYGNLNDLSDKGLSIGKIYDIDSTNIERLKTIIRSANANAGIPNRRNNPSIYPKALLVYTKDDLSKILMLLNKYQPAYDKGVISEEQKTFIDNIKIIDVELDPRYSNEITFVPGQSYKLDMSNFNNPQQD